MKFSAEYRAAHGAYWIPTSCRVHVCTVTWSVILIRLVSAPFTFSDLSF